MNQQISTQYENYQELLLDLDIFGRLSSTKQLDLKEYEELFYEEFKQQKPFPTMESKRYELSRIVDSSYRVEYLQQIELRENERLVDFNEESEGEQRRLEDIEVSEEVKNLFHYENQVHDRDREEIMKKYSLENGELLQGVRPEKLMGTIQEDESLVLDDVEIENIGSDERKFHDESVEPVEQDSEAEYDEFDEILGIEPVQDFEADVEPVSDIDLEEEQNEDYEPDIDSEEEQDKEYEPDIEEQEEDFEPDIDDFDSEEEQEKDFEPDIDDFDSEEEQEEDFEPEFDSEEEQEDNSDEPDSKEIEQKNQDLSVEQLMQMLGSKLHLDADQLKQMVKQTENKPKEQEEDDTLDDFFAEEEPKEAVVSIKEDDTLDDFFAEEEPKEAVVSTKEDDTLDDFFAEDKPKEVVVSTKEVKEPIEQPIDRSSEPTDLRAFIRKHPRCDYDFATKYFTPKQIAMEIKKGRVIKKGNMLKI